jgi:hypothetical protein
MSGEADVRTLTLRAPSPNSTSFALIFLNWRLFHSDAASGKSKLTAVGRAKSTDCGEFGFDSIASAKFNPARLATAPPQIQIVMVRDENRLTK